MEHDDIADSERHVQPEPKVDPESLVLRARPAPAIRFKRGVIVAVAAATAVGIAGTAWVALKPTSLHIVAGDDEQSRVARAPSDAISALPKSYGDAPKLGPPLPGDLGKPILDRQRELAVGPPLPYQPGVADPAQGGRDRKASELKTARESGLLFQLATRQPSVATTIAPAPTAGPGPSLDAGQPTGLPLDPDRDPNGQQRKADFIRSADKGGDINPYTISAPVSPYTLAAGSVIAASLITGLRSDLPGMVTAQVTERVYDSATGRILLIPQGARLIGSYDSVVAFGQSRALVVWQRIIWPDGRSIRIENMPAADPSGYAGLSDQVSFHTWTVLKGVAISTLLGVGAELQFGGQNDLVQALRQSSQQNVSRAGDQLTARNLQIQPTITIRPGAQIRLLVHRDLILLPWKE